jgi:TRAP-type C4-dicarboxylate transport system permease small subunit
MNKLLVAVRRAGDFVGVAIFASVFVAINYQVFMRYIMNQPVGWSEEFPTIAFSLAVLWSASFMLNAADHIVFTLFAELLPDWVRRAISTIANIVMAALFTAVLPAVIDFALYMKVLSSPILRIRYDFVFSFFALFVGITAWRSGAAALRSMLSRRSNHPHKAEASV